MKQRYVVLLLAFSLLVAFRLSGSSIGMDWYFLYGEVESDPNLLIGSPQVIRSDEYAIETPWTVMESRVGFSQHNPFIGSGQNLILTDVPKVCLHFNTPQEKTINRMNIADAKRYLAEGHFSEGSMAPKIQACINYLEAGGGEVLITDPAHLPAAIRGETGTRLVP